VAAIDKLCDVLTAHDIEFRRLHIDAAAHSSMVESVTGEFFHFLSQFRFGTPSIPFVSNTTGTWITPAQACDPSYWVEHLRHTVRFSEGLTQLLSKDGLVLFETGPSNTLSNLAKSQCNERSSFIHACMRHPRIPASDIQVLHTTIAKAWNTGLPVNWLALYRAKTTRRLSLPTYPFERQRYWLNAHPTATDQEMEPNTVSPSAVQLYELTWKVSQDGSQSAANKGSFEDHWLVLSDDLGVGRALQELLQNHNQSVIFVAADPKFTSTGVNSYTVRPSSDRDMQCVLEHLNSAGIRKLKVVHLWQLTEVTQAAEQLEELDGILNRGLFSLVALSKALARIASSIELEFIAVTNHTIQMSGAEVIRPENNMFVAAARVIPAEVKNTTLRIIDFNIDSFSRQTCGRVANQVLAEALTNSSVPFVAYRGNQRWVPRYTAISSTSRKTYMQLKQGGVYLLTGGVGQLGPIVASFFASCVCCTLILTTRSPFPQRSEWEALARADKEDQVSRTARMLIDIEKQGSKIIVLTADAASELAMQAVFHELDTRFGTIDGVVHLAGVTGPQSLQLLTDLEKEVCIRQFLPKLQGCYVLSKLLADRPIDFCILFSSTASIFGGVGMSAYAAANGFLDSFSTTRHLSSDQRWITLNWDAWLTDMSPDFVGNGQTALDRFAISSKQALTMLQQALAHAPGGPYVVSTGHVEARIKEMFNTSSQTLHSPAVAELHKRPVLVSDYVAPRTISERNVGAIWQDVLGLERVGIHDNFFELGGNSLIGLKIVSKIKTMLHVHLPVTALFEAPTVATLAQIIDHAENDNYEDSRRRGELRRQQKLIPA
jgi:acyl transferase domain-containing protein